ncbi:MAG: hypothetical protein M3540_12690 [Actinomycetota bacterium]|nr:hypothetical protein [Actinomycetota bacterium]
MRGKSRRQRRPAPGARLGWASALFAAGCLLAAPSAAAQTPPPNDTFAAAAVLSGTVATVTGTNFGATKEPGEPNHAGRPGGHSVWWRWTAPAAGPVTIDTCDSDFNTLLAVYTGTTVSALSLVKSNDDAEPCDIGSSVTFTATSGQVYSIAVDGGDEEEGQVRLKLQPTLRLEARVLVRRGAVDATRFTIEIASIGEDDFPDPPQLVLERGGRRSAIDLELDNELDSETRFRYTFNWSCDRRGVWRWTVSLRRDGERASQEGTFTVPGCQRQGWFVSASKVRRDFASDFGGRAARYLSCRQVGPRRGPLAHTWRCTLVQPGAVCSGSFLFRYSLTVQGGEVVQRTRKPSGGVTCRS